MGWLGGLKTHLSCHYDILSTEHSRGRSKPPSCIKDVHAKKCCAPALQPTHCGGMILSWTTCFVYSLVSRKTALLCSVVSFFANKSHTHTQPHTHSRTDTHTQAHARQERSPREKSPLPNLPRKVCENHKTAPHTIHQDPFLKFLQHFSPHCPFTLSCTFCHHSAHPPCRDFH